MQKNIINKALVFFITLIFLITSITPVIYADITEKNNTIESLDETDFEYNITETVPEIPIKPNNFSADNNPDNTAIDTMFNFSLYNQNTNNQNNSNPRDDDDVELLSIHYDEDIFILDNGVAIFNISINIPDSIYAEKYKQALGVPKNVTMGQVMEIPVNPTNASDDKNMSAGRKSYYRSVSSEQWFLLGLLTEITYSEMIPLNENGECKVFLQGIAYPKINDINGDTWTLGFGPKETDNMSSVTQYVSSIVGYSKLMMETFQDEQVFKRTWTTKIHLPKDSILYNISELEEKKWTLDFCDNTYFFTDISIENESIVVIDESLVVSETDDVNPASIVNYKSFELEYTITNPQAYNGFERSSLILENNTFYGGVLWHSDLIDWNWHYESNCTLYEYNNSGAQVQIDQHLEVDLKFKLIVHLDLEQAYVKPIFNASGLYILTFYGEIVYTPDPYSFIDYSTWFHFWLGPVWVGIQINAGCQLNFIFETYATAEFKTGIYVNASLKAGATYSIWNGFHIIWQPYFNTDFIEPTFEGTIDVFIRPSISFPISAMVYGIIGPQVTPELYLEGTFHGEYIQGQVDYFWYIKLGFCIYIGLRIGIPYIWSASWDWEIADWTILDWSSHDPSKDTLPPTTTLMAFPKKNGFIGRSLYVWFSAIDNGDVPSGVDETKFKVAYHPLMTYNYPDIWNITIIEPSYPGIYYDLYDINYYSIDNFGQQESTNTYWVDADLQPPTSIISPPSGSHIVGYEDPVTIQVPGSDATGYQVWYRIKSDTEPWSDWFSGEDDSSDTFIITNQYVGTCEVEYYSCDGLSNKENSKYAVYTVTSGYGGPVS